MHKADSTHFKGEVVIIKAVITMITYKWNNAFSRKYIVLVPTLTNLFV